MLSLAHQIHRVFELVDAFQRFDRRGSGFLGPIFPEETLCVSYLGAVDHLPVSIGIGLCQPLQEERVQATEEAGVRFRLPHRVDGGVCSVLLVNQNARRRQKR
jgi:hypothetical protein